MCCQRICKEAQIVVASVEYRLMPQNPPQKAPKVAHEAFLWLISKKRSLERLILAGSLSEGQLAAQVAQLAHDSEKVPRETIDGLLFRYPFTMDESNGGIHVLERFRLMHTSFAPSFKSSLLTNDADHARKKHGQFTARSIFLPHYARTFIQLCSNNLYYSNSIYYAEALREAGIDVKFDVGRRWPHTFWLKAPRLDRALEAEMDIVEGHRWLLKIDSKIQTEQPLIDFT